MKRFLDFEDQANMLCDLLSNKISGTKVTHDCFSTKGAFISFCLYIDRINVAIIDSNFIAELNNMYYDLNREDEFEGFVSVFTEIYR